MGTNNIAFDKTKVYPVYILSRVVEEIKEFCTKCMPNEAIGVLLGYKLKFNNKLYTKIVDWATGSANISPSHAEFTEEGVLEYHLFIEERYMNNKNRPHVVGVFHSHPFGTDPAFSGIDISTFSNPLYLENGNIFILLDPSIDAFKVFVIEKDEGNYVLRETDWCEYSPHIV